MPTAATISSKHYAGRLEHIRRVLSDMQPRSVQHENLRSYNKRMSFTALDQPNCSHDLDPSGFYLLPKLRGHHVWSDDGVRQ
jgi:hypothetical protein